MPDELNFPESSIWLDWEYHRFLHRAGVRPRSSRGSNVEDAFLRTKTYADRNPDAGLSGAMERVQHDKKLTALMQAGAEFGFGLGLSGHAHALEPALRAHSQELPSPVIVRQLATDEYNACAINTVSGYLILVDTGVPFFINQCGKVAGYACPEFVKFPAGPDYRPELTPDRSQQMEGGNLLAFSALALGIQAAKYIANREPSALSFLPQSHPVKFQVLIDVVISAERFMIAHEFGHILKQHLVAKASLEDAPVRAIEQELEADRLGAELLLTPELSRFDIFGAPTDELSFDAYVERALAGIALFCASDHLVEVANDRLDGQKKQARKTHPSAIARWSSLQSGLQPHWKDRMEFADSLFSFFSRISPAAAECASNFIAGDDGP